MTIDITFIILAAVFGLGMFGVLIALFMVSRKSQKTMQSMLTFINRPEKAKIYDASRVMGSIVGNEIEKIGALFKMAENNLGGQVKSVEKLKDDMTAENDRFIKNSDEIIKKISQMSQRMENTVNGLESVVASNGWKDVEKSTEGFYERISGVMERVDTTSCDIIERTTKLQTVMEKWLKDGEKLFNLLDSNSDKSMDKMGKLNQQADIANEKIGGMAKTIVDGFNYIKEGATDYAKVLKNNSQTINDHTKQIEAMAKKSKSTLISQVNALEGAANTAESYIQLAEVSIGKQRDIIVGAVEQLNAAVVTSTDSTTNVSEQITSLVGTFNKEVKEFSDEIIFELKNASDVANETLGNTTSTASKFSESVRVMAAGIDEMEEKHVLLSQQSERLMRVAADAAEQLKPLLILIEKQQELLPIVSKESVELHAELKTIVADIEEKSNSLKQNVTSTISEVEGSSEKLNFLSGESRQHMIDLIKDYNKAADELQALNKQMIVARATAPMEAIKAQPQTSFAPVSSTDFLEQARPQIEKIHEISFDLIKSSGAVIPDKVWQKYHDGDNSIFSKWLAKIFVSVDKKKVRDLLKSNTAFKSQAMQFVRGYEQILAAAKQADNADTLKDSLMNNDLGKIYQTFEKHF